MEENGRHGSGDPGGENLSTAIFGGSTRRIADKLENLKLLFLLKYFYNCF